MGFGPLWKGCWAAKRERLYGYPVNRWSTKRPPNGTKLDRRSTGAIPRPLGKHRSIPKKFNTRTQQETKEGRRHSYVIRHPPFVSCCERVLNILGMDRDFPSGPGIAPVDHLSSFGSFGARLVLQRLSA